MPKPRVKFEPSWKRKKLTPPEGGSLIVHMVVNVEHWVFDKPMPRVILPAPMGGDHIPDVANWSWKEYGMRCGLPRILKLFEEFGIRASTSINGNVCNTYPDLAKAMHEAGWDFMGHGFVQLPMSMVEDERKVIQDTQQAIEKFTGKKMRGWMGPGLVESFETADILKELGVDWICDWVVDDLPVEVDTTHGPLIGVPYTVDLSDITIYALGLHESDEMFRRFTNSLSVYLEESRESPRVLAIALHPYVIGVAHRIGMLRRMIEKLHSLPGVVYMTGSEIADWYSAQQ